ncbi:tyrosine--tRNA ligase [Nannocystis sp. ILAH1]|uniref:tyrosine--tRNA ligase n=1 Tax=unclassified Nannocystis TaxID=2627009 RepID=UPI00226D6167|nr:MULTISPECIES: tyrosine--tRNA ligase [unclassified Nannocystis]MCY0993237.1 tyrosine--tRNA ligase [Nannocystis sp. ILAH1]MCY1063330.1 tyrosine--tRNA ligase [Nannocystis sp. RBIL2]
MNATPPQPPRSAALQRMLERGYFEQASDFAATDAALDSGMVTFYVGYDPTGASLHVGHLVQIMGMRALQRAGHKPIVIVGGGTGMIGDPSGKMETRKLLTREDVAVNAAGLKAQLGRFLHFDSGRPNDAVMLDNADWLLGLKYIEFLRDVGRHFTVNRMIAVKTYRDRLDAEIPLSFLEFNYQLLQAYDFLHLFRHHGCTLQFGGSDQWGNMVAGIELIRRMTPDGQPNAAYCLTLPLLLTADNRKMGKTERGAVWLDPERLTPFEYYQFWIGCDDRDVVRLLKTFTDVPLAEIEALTAEGGAALKGAKARLAFEATALLHGLDHATQARQASEQAFGSSEDWSAVPLVTVPGPEIRLVDLVTHPEIEAFKSKREARERIAAGAVKLNGEPVTDPAHLVIAAQTGDQGLRLQSGKKCRFRVTFA